MTMVILSPLKDRVIPLPNGLVLAYKWGAHPNYVLKRSTYITKHFRYLQRSVFSPRCSFSTYSGGILTYVSSMSIIKAYERESLVMKQPFLQILGTSKLGTIRIFWCDYLHTVDGSEMRLVGYPIIYQVFIHSNGGFSRISASPLNSDKRRHPSSADLESLPFSKVVTPPRGC